MNPSPRSKLAAVAAGLFAATSLAACSSAGPARSSTNAGASSAEASGVAYAKAQISKFEKKFENARDHYGTPEPVPNVANLHGKTVWYVPLGASVPVLNSLGNAISQALANLGADVHVCDGKFSPSTVANCMDAAATHGASEVITGFVDYSSVPSAFQSLASRGIPTLVGGEARPKGVSINKNLGFFDTSPLTQTADKLMADAVIADSGGRAKVLQVGLSDSPTTVENTAVTDTEFRQHCPGCTVTTVSTKTSDMAKLGSLISANLAANPDTGYVLLPQDAFLEAALPGLQSAGFTSRVKIVTAGGSTAGLQATKAHQVAYDIGLGATEQGWAMADAGLRLLSGAPITPEIQGPVRVFTPDNVTSLDLNDANYNTSVWYGGDGWKQDFLKAWGANN